MFFGIIFSTMTHPLVMKQILSENILSEISKRKLAEWGIQLKMSASYQPQTYGASETMNKVVENYIGCYASYLWNDWNLLLPSTGLLKT